MKVAIIFLDYQRHDFSTLAMKSIAEAGHPFDLFTINRKGIAAAINEGIRKAKGYDAIVTCANDIVMPFDWLKRMVQAAEAIPNTGMCGIHTVEGLEPEEEINGIRLHRSFTAFGNVLIPMKAIDTIGGFNEDYDPYGMQDADFAYRLNKTGFVNYYLHGLKADHVGNDVGQQTEYRKMKDKGLAESADKWNFWTTFYDYSENYIIDLKQMV